MDRIASHESNQLHRWCLLQEELEKEFGDNFNEKNKEAGLIFIRNVVRCLMRGQSLEDCVLTI
jgi:hypothetical protein